jgi:hypothetical protein
MANRCPTCDKKVTRQQYKVTCTLCRKSTHYKCLPTYNDQDIEYAKSPNGHWSCTYCLQNLFPFSNLEENDWIINDCTNENIHDIESLNEMIFNPFDLNEIDEEDDLDPDNIFYGPIMQQNVLGCKYYNTQTLNLETNSKPLNSVQLSMLTLNIRSLPRNHKNLIPLLNIIDNQFHIISLTETWLKEYNADLFPIEGYAA